MQFHGSFVSVSVWLKELLHILSLYKICEHWFNVLDSQKNLHVPLISIRLLQIGLIVQHFHFYFLVFGIHLNGNCSKLSNPADLICY